MVVRLHERAAADGKAVRGLSCDENGVYFAGDCALVTVEPIKGRRLYRVRPIEDINKALSAGYGMDFDLGWRMPALERVAELMTAGEWGLAQITTLQMRLPELPDDEAVERLLKADDLLRFNPNHLPAGPGGGQFTSGPSAGSAVQTGVSGHHAPTPKKSVPQLGYRTTARAPSTPFWATQFTLSHPSALGGFIIQKNDTAYVISPTLTVNEPTFWEALRVNPGASQSIYVGTGTVGGGDDVWAGTPGIEGSHGVQIDTGTARFYEGLTPEQLKQYGFSPSNAGPAGGVTQPNTRIDPKLPTDNASNVLVRTSKNKF